MTAKKKGPHLPSGRPTSYRPEYAEVVGKLCKLGATDAQLADFFEVTISTISLWKIQHPEFSAALKLYKEVADSLVEKSLYRRAMGYEADEVDIRVIEGQIVQTPIRKVYPPDTTAMIFWLKNRKSKEWRDKVDQEITGADGAPLKVEVIRRVIVDGKKP